MLIGEVAEYVGTSPRSLRHYERTGLLSPTREDNGYRVYTRSDVARAAKIKELLDLGLTTADVHEYLAAGCLDGPVADEHSCSEEIPTVQQRLRRVDALVLRLQGVRDSLARYSEHLEHQAPDC